MRSRRPLHLSDRYGEAPEAVRLSLCDLSDGRLFEFDHVATHVEALGRDSGQVSELARLKTPEYS
jgi:hypothetical protein